MQSWDDVRIFLEVARRRKLSLAARALGVDTSTVSRKLALLERRLAVRLFERTRDGLVATPAAERLVASAAHTEHAVAAFFDDAARRETEVAGTVRVTAPPGIVELVLLPRVAELRRRHPRLLLELDASQAVASLASTFGMARREADIAIRLARPSGEGLVVRRVGASPAAILATPKLARALAPLASFDDAPWIAWDAAHAHFAYARWLAQHVGVAPVVRLSTMLAQIAAASAGIGVGLLPALVAPRAGLVPVALARSLAGKGATLPSDVVYLVRAAALRDTPRVTAVWTFCLEALTHAPRALSRKRARQSFEKSSPAW